MADWHRATLEKTVQTLGTDADRGLDDDQARRLLQEHGPNELVERVAKSPWRMLLDRGARRHILWVGVLIAAIALGVGFLYYEPGDKTWQTMMFTALAFTQIGHALGLRAAGENKRGWRSIAAALRANPAMLGVAVLTIVLQLAAVYLPFLDEFFEVVPLSATDFGICVALGLVVWGAVEVEKRLVQRAEPIPARQQS